MKAAAYLLQVFRCFIYVFKYAMILERGHIFCMCWTRNRNLHLITSILIPKKMTFPSYLHFSVINVKSCNIVNIWLIGTIFYAWTRCLTNILDFLSYSLFEPYLTRILVIAPFYNNICYSLMQFIITSSLPLADSTSR